MPTLPIADKATLDAVMAYVDELEARLTATRAAYLDYLNNLNTRLTDTRAGKLDLVGTTGDSAGTSTLFARLAQIAGYTDQVEGFVDTLETNLGTTAQTASSSGTALQRLAHIISCLPGVASVAYASDTVKMLANTERSTTGSVTVLVKRFVVTVSGSVRLYTELKNSVGGGGVKTHVLVYLDGERITSSLEGATTSYTASTLDISDVKVGSVIDVYFYGGLDSTAYIRNTRIEYDLIAPGSIVD